eukprot:Awhi_evm2s7682
MWNNKAPPEKDKIGQECEKDAINKLGELKVRFAALQGKEFIPPLLHFAFTIYGVNWFEQNITSLGYKEFSFDDKEISKKDFDAMIVTANDYFFLKGRLLGSAMLIPSSLASFPSSLSSPSAPSSEKDKLSEDDLLLDPKIQNLNQGYFAVQSKLKNYSDDIPRINDFITTFLEDKDDLRSFKLDNLENHQSYFKAEKMNLSLDERELKMLRK